MCNKLLWYVLEFNVYKTPNKTKWQKIRWNLYTCDWSIQLMTHVIIDQRSSARLTWSYNHSVIWGSASQKDFGAICPDMPRYAQICPSPRSRCAGPWTFLPTCSLNICDPLWLQTYKWPNFGTQTNTHKAIWATQILARYTQADQDICKDFRSFNPCFRIGASCYVMLNTLIGHLRVELVGNFWPKWLYLKP